MARAGSIIENPRRREKIVFLRAAADTGGRLLELRVEVKPTLERPPLHAHPRQEERFQIEAGELTYTSGGRQGSARVGEVVIIPAGVAHTWWNEGPDTLVVHAEMEPAGRFETFIETIYGLTRSGRVNRRGIPSPLQTAVLFHEFRHEWVPVFLPWPVRRVLFPALAVIGRARGLRPWYPGFSPDGPVEEALVDAATAGA